MWNHEVAFGIKCYIEVYIRALYQQSRNLTKFSLQYFIVNILSFTLNTEYDLHSYNTLATH